MKKICVVTAARSEYGCLRWILEEIRNSADLVLQLIVTGGHLAANQGMTIEALEADGFIADKKVDMQLSDPSATGLCHSMGLCLSHMGRALDELRPDVLLVLGDRYELLPVCSAAVVMNIPIAHISGGDITLGAIDQKVRDAVTMMASLHFPCSEMSAQRVIKMTGRDDNVVCIGEPGLEAFLRHPRLTRKELAADLGLDIDKQWIISTLHPETTKPVSYSLEMAKNLVDALSELEDYEIIFTAANADLGGEAINQYLMEAAQGKPDKFHFTYSLGSARYISLMRQATALVGNSSSGILEAPFLGIPVVNIGDRQLGRHLCANVISASADKPSITEALKKLKDFHPKPDYYYGDGHSATKVVETLIKTDF